ncbi:AcrR family transcriptional regulator [Caulobacter ginsengisoli]|uniref:AcrR family transcriptional regulator n=1 Tax=Caulobacter ginsengisoli TaxID=400775 RepID=A0ABU0IRB7_9CAUL|nr:TetR/AcrR family transcriptional regulator [Caulobacter ginsengisoli]MDQ0464557.1 AcrR family transcriptional regulator [Caulobacter ginsengisoli]
MRTELHQARRDRILDVAAATFAEFGYERTKVETLAHDAQVSTATVYNYFRTKPAIFAAVVERALAPFLGLFDEIETDEGPAEAVLLAYARLYFRFMSDPRIRGVYRTVSAEVAREPHLGQTLYNQAHGILGGALRRLLSRFAGRGELVFDDVAVTARILQGMLEHVTLTIPLLTSDDAQPLHPEDSYCVEAVRVFLAAYGR